MDRKIFEDLAPGSAIGLIGAGKFGTELKREALKRGFRVLLCDPPKADAAAEEVNDALHIEWGNGMGGCDFSRLETETYLPKECLARSAGRISVQVPLNDSTRGMLDAAFLALCRKHGTAIYCCSDPEIIAKDVRNSELITYGANFKTSC